MGKTIFSSFFLIIPIVAFLLLVSYKRIVSNLILDEAFSSTFPIILIYYLSISIIWIINWNHIEDVDNKESKSNKY